MSVLKYNQTDRSLVLELDKHELVDENTYGSISATGFMSCLPMKYSQKKRAFRYDLTDVVSFRVRLEDVVTLDDFYYLVYKFYDAMLAIFQTGVNPNKIDWEPNLVFIDKLGNVQFTVYPLQVKTVEGKSIFHFLSTILRHAKPYGRSDGEGINRLIGFLEKVNHGEISQEDFIYSLGGESRAYFERNLQDYQPSRLFERAQTNHEVLSEIDSQGVSSPKTTGYGDVELDLSHIATDVYDKTSILIEDNSDLDKTQVLSDEAEVDSTTLVGYIETPTTTVELDTRVGVDTWKLGKKPNTESTRGEVAIPLRGIDYLSRNHFEIVYENSSKKFYISDLGSANGTWVDGQKVYNQPIELLNGSIIKLARTEVKFTTREI